VRGPPRFLISQRPDVEAAITAELDAAGLLATRSRPSPPHIGLDDLARLPYLGCVCKARSPRAAAGRAQSCELPRTRQ
jgi:hypothetical protein